MVILSILFSYASEILTIRRVLTHIYTHLIHQSQMALVSKVNANRGALTSLPVACSQVMAAAAPLKRRVRQKADYICSHNLCIY